MSGREELLAQIERDREKIIAFYRGFIQAKSPNPPGDTRAAVSHICKFLDRETLPYKVVAPMEMMPNVVGSFESETPGRHLVLNGHIDVFPVGDDDTWSRDPWGGVISNNCIYGRGACDMKAGTTASIFTYLYLYQMREHLKGKLTLTAVSDEETFGPWGARYLIEHLPETHGDSLLNGEPSGIYNIRFGEKGVLWLALTVQTAGAHGAHTHQSASATKIASKLMLDLERLTRIPAQTPRDVMEALELAAPGMEKSMGKGGASTLSEVTLNIGRIQGGLKINMVPSECRIEADIRLPIGVDKPRIMQELEQVVSRYEGIRIEELNYNPPSSCDPNGELMQILRSTVRSLCKIDPMPTISLGGTDARLWRYRNIPAYIYGPPPKGMGSHDEHVQIDDFFHVLRTHVISAYEYLSRR